MLGSAVSHDVCYSYPYIRRYKVKIANLKEIIARVRAVICW